VAVPDGNIYSVQVAPDGRIWIVGDFLTTGAKTTNGIAWWNGNEWDSVPSLAKYKIKMSLLAFGPTGIVYSYSSYSNSIYKWKDFELDASVSSPSQNIYTLAIDRNGDLVLAGSKFDLGVVDVPNLYRWNGFAFELIEGKGINGAVNRMIRMDDGSMILGGEFTSVYGVKANRVVRKTGDVWTALGDGFKGTVRHLAKGPNGKVYASGDFLLDSSRLAVWNGTTWKAIPGVKWVSPMHVLADGRLVVGTTSLAGRASMPYSPVAIWNDTAWIPSKTKLSKETVHPQGIGVDGKGRLVIAFGVESSYYDMEIWREEDTAWKNIGGFNGLNPRIDIIKPLSNGGFLVAGSLDRGTNQTFDGIAVYDTIWHSLRDTSVGRYSSSVYGVDVAPDGTIWIAGHLTNQQAIVTAYDGKSWHRGGVLGGDLNFFNSVKAILLDENGLPYIGGDFRRTPSSATSFFSHLAPPSTGIADRTNPRAVSFLTGAGATARIAKAGRLEILDARGTSLWSGAVDVGFRPSQAATGTGLRLLRMGRETVRVLF